MSTGLRRAATLVVVRDAPSGLEVLLLRRAERGDHNSGAWVFPGGVVDEGDRAAHACCAGLDDAAASAQLGLPEGGLDFHVAAVRECFEECGLLLATQLDGSLLPVDDDRWHRLAEWRGLLHRGERTLCAFCEAAGVRLAVDRLVYLSHWVTPLGRAKRFDTRFFVAEAPAGQVAAHDANELVEQRWLRPADALAQSGQLKLMTPTQKTLEAMARFTDVQGLMAWARSPRDLGVIMPRVGIGAHGPRPVTPDEPAYAELGRIDPQGHGNGCYDIQPGVPVRLSDRVIRVTANNGSVMTGPGTNTYLVGGGPRNEWAVIDPGPLDETHVAAVLAAAPGAIRWIFATHTHQDHSPATGLLKARTGARVHGRLPAHPQWQDATFVPEVALSGGERIALHDSATLRVIHTPGHASNHLCYLLEEEKTLFAGDHVMQLSTVVINPPDGDMAAYVASLRALMAEDLDWIAPGHGFLMAQPGRAMAAIVAHRLRREQKVLAALEAAGPASVEQLLSRVYDDVPPRLHPVAARSLTAHLLKLRDEGAAATDGAHWWATGARPG
ncbi:MBL fold metallo-hydrolase [Ideonella sp. BN130291]|uniref:MBL fold metallo-hydrolase n=1 Tax=Ideonella sp. BN130291 TaxID=3112940 RepID=UPI003FA603C9